MIPDELNTGRWGGVPWARLDYRVKGFLVDNRVRVRVFGGLQREGYEELAEGVVVGWICTSIVGADQETFVVVSNDDGEKVHVFESRMGVQRLDVNHAERPQVDLPRQL